MSEKFRLDRKIGFRNRFYTKCINVIIDSIGPSIILRSIFQSFVSIFAKKKSDRTRCLAVSILEYNLGPKITGSEVQY